MGTPPKADGCGKPNPGPGAVIPGIWNMEGAAGEAPHIPVVGILVVAGGPK